MGWYYPYGYTRKSLIKDLVKFEKNERRTRRCLKYALRGNILWTVWEIAIVSGEKMRYIGCDLLVRYKDEWGYKPMDEGCGPSYWTCPVKYLDMVPEMNPEWRKGVREYHVRLIEKKRAKSDAKETFQMLQLGTGY